MKINKNPSNIPLIYYDNIKSSNVDECVQYPGVADINFNNLYWQVLYTEQATYYLNEAFLDVRERKTKGNFVRMIGMMHKSKREELYCHLWFNSSQPVHVESKVVEFEYLFNSKPTKKWLRWVKDSKFSGQISVHDWTEDHIWPFMMSCKIPNQYSDQVPDSVSLSQKKCEKFTNNVR